MSPNSSPSPSSLFLPPTSSPYSSSHIYNGVNDSKRRRKRIEEEEIIILDDRWKLTILSSLISPSPPPSSSSSHCSSHISSPASFLTRSPRLRSSPNLDLLIPSFRSLTTSSRRPPSSPPSPSSSSSTSAPSPSLKSPSLQTLPSDKIIPPPLRRRRKYYGLPIRRLRLLPRLFYRLPPRLRPNPLLYLNVLNLIRGTLFSNLFFTPLSPRLRRRRLNEEEQQNSDMINANDVNYVAMRNQAIGEGDLMARAFGESKLAYTRGDKVRAGELSAEGKNHQRLMNDFNEKAAEWIYTR